MKFFQGDLKVHKPPSLFSRALRLFLLDLFDTAIGAIEGSLLIGLFFHIFKNLRQREGDDEFEEWVSDSDVLLSVESDSLSPPLMHASITPLGEEASSFSFSMSRHLKSTVNTIRAQEFRKTHKMTCE